MTLYHCFRVDFFNPPEVLTQNRLSVICIGKGNNKIKYRSFVIDKVF